MARVSVLPSCSRATFSGSLSRRSSQPRERLSVGARLGTLPGHCGFEHTGFALGVQVCFWLIRYWIKNSLCCTGCGVAHFQFSQCEWYFARVTQDRAWPIRRLEWVALALMLCAALGWLPWLAWPAVIVAAFVPWLARVLPGARPYAPFSSIYAALAVFLTPRNSALEAVLAFFVALVLAYLLGLAFDGVRSGSSWSWGAVLLLLLPNPNALGVLAALSLGVLGALERQRERSSEMAIRAPRALVLVALSAVGIAGVSAFLPSPTAWVDWTTQSGALGRTETKPDQSKSAVRQRAPLRASEPRRVQTSRSNTVTALETLFMITTVGVLIFLFVLLRRAQPEKGRWSRRQWWDLMPLIAGSILMMALLALYALGPPGGNSGFGSVSEPSSSAAEIDTSQTSRPAPQANNEPARDSNIPLAMVALVIALALWVWWRLRGRSSPEIAALELEVTSSDMPSRAAANRIRLAYRAFLELCERIGEPRAASETPLEFGHRLSAIHLEQHEMIAGLTELYESVRYGGLALPDRAAEAEQIVARLQMEWS
jgi:Domain of unknown function (DUF4129)